MTQLLLHLWGDYILQSDWMAQNKTKSSLAAGVHAVCYSLPFLLLRPKLDVWIVILVTHFFIDRFRLARYVVWAKNWAGPFYYPVDVTFGKGPGEYVERQWRRRNPIDFFSECPHGYPASTPVWMAVWLLIIADNILHLTFNYLALRYL